MFVVTHSLLMFHVIVSFYLDSVYCPEPKDFNNSFLHFNIYLGLLFFIFK